MNRVQMQSDERFERRLQTRYSSSDMVFFAANQKLYEGELKNFSEAGASIKSCNFLFSGELVNVALPHENKKRMGKVVWSTRSAFGIKFDLG
jgi:hypothetical protein